jgi:hypothetical protein
MTAMAADVGLFCIPVLDIGLCNGQGVGRMWNDVRMLCAGCLVAGQQVERAGDGCCEGGELC